MRPAWQEREDDTYLRMCGMADDPAADFDELMALRDEVTRQSPASCTPAEIEATVRQVRRGGLFTSPPCDGPLEPSETAAPNERRDRRS